MSNVQVNQRSINADGVRELKVPVADAHQALQKNGLDEVFFSQDGRNYVAYGDNIRFTELKKGGELTYNGRPAVVWAKSDEAASVRDGVKRVLLPSAAIATVGGVLTKAVFEAGRKEFALSMSRAGAWVGGTILLAGTAAATAVVLGGGGLHWAVKPRDRASLDAVTK